MSEKQCVAIVDDDEDVLDSLQSLLRRRGFETVAMSSALALLSALDAGAEFCCLVSDIRMPRMSGHRLHAELKQRGVTTPVIFVTGHGDVDVAVMSMKSGIHDFIEKPIDGSRLVKSVQEAIKLYEANKETDTDLAKLRDRYAELSDRQKEVMLLAANGRQNKEIAAILKISSRTVEHYRESVMERMNAKNIVELVKMAMKLNLRSPIA